MIIELIKDWQHESGKVFKKGTQLEIHPSDGEILIKKKIAKEFDKQLNIKENGRNSGNN